MEEKRAFKRLPLRLQGRFFEKNITGSFNFTKAAEEKNAEILLIIHDKKLAEIYTKNWQEHEKHSEVYVGKGKVPKLQLTCISELNRLYLKQFSHNYLYTRSP
jgi:phosphatidylserine/phosphatidylglycerophosphate/cardiolipin synthase-like enzyme